MKTKYNLIRFFLLAGIISITLGSCKKKKTEYTLENLEIPDNLGNQVIKHFAYSLSYNENHEQADWVAYVLTKEEAESSLFNRTDDFREDPEVISGSASLEDYVGTGYDRGHLAPAGDMAWSDTAMTESFYMSNMSPQEPSFNRGKWKELESLVREWAITFGEIYVITGPVLSDDLFSIGDNKVSVPHYYYKVILDYEHKRGIGFLMANQKLDGDIYSYAVDIKQVEQAAGIDFFYKLDDKIENEIESTLIVSDWQSK